MLKPVATSPMTQVEIEERRKRRARYLFAAVFGLIFLSYLVTVVTTYTETGVLNVAGAPANWINLMVSFVALLLAYHVVPRRVLSEAMQMVLATGLFISGLWVASVFNMSRADELGRITVLLTALVGLMLITQALPWRYVPTAIGVLAVGTLLLTLLDLYWTGPRPVLTEVQRGVAYVFTVLVAGILVLIVARDFRDYSLQAKLIGTTLFLTMAIVGVTTYTVGVVIRNTVSEQAEERLHVLTQTQALAMGELLARQVNTLQTMAFNVVIQNAAAVQSRIYSGTPDEIEADLLATDFRWIRARDNDPLIQQYQSGLVTEELLEFVRAFPENAELFVTDKYGGLVATTRRTTDFYQADEAWWQEAYNVGFGAVFIDVPQNDQSTGVLGLTIAVPVFSQPESGEAKELVGVVRTTYRIDALVEFLGTTQTDIEGNLDIYFPDGTSLRVVDNAIQYQVAPLSPPSIERLLPSFTTVASFNYEGVSSLVTRYPVSTLSGEETIAELGWYIVSAQAEADAFAPVTAQQRTNILLGVAAVIVGGIAAAVVAQILTAPIVRLTEAANRVTRGDLQTRVLVSSQDEIGMLSHSFNLMTDQLLDAINNLEQRVQERTHALNISTEVGRRLSTILERQQLVAETVQQIRDGFNYYHAHMYLFDEEGKDLLMVGGTGQAGQVMLAQNHKIKIGQGLVGRAAATNLPIIVPDVSKEADWLPNDLLPETRAEIAVPIAIGKQVIGVLDVQHNVVKGLQQQDADLLLSIANQVAIALQNTRLLEESRLQAERITRVNAMREKIQSTTTIDDALQVAARELGRLTGASQTIVRLQPNGHHEDTPATTT
jgi:putative methionine-R-sulfoxide reductase with GAF domain